MPRMQCLPSSFDCGVKPCHLKLSSLVAPPRVYYPCSGPLCNDTYSKLNDKKSGSLEKSADTCAKVIIARDVRDINGQSLLRVGG